MNLSIPLKSFKGTSIGKTDEQAKTDALEAGGKSIGQMPKIPFTRSPRNAAAQRVIQYHSLTNHILILVREML